MPRVFGGFGYALIFGLGFGIGAGFGLYTLGRTLIYFPSPITGFLYTALVGGNGAHGRWRLIFIELFNLIPYPFHPLHVSDAVEADSSALVASLPERAFFADHSRALTMATICASVSLLIRQIRAKIRRAAG